ncbi:hypothetical protein KY338_01550 [Candidatus Woesearchaeota archaeon]|nr:hypothetical protein [Candidatus Woesearchaeota archaeon]MBW3005598.1 hypothetical protein [Candidatus Woesearchaeota archaeon]
MKKPVPIAWIFGGVLFAILLTIFLVRKAAITGGVATGGAVSSLTVTPASSGMLTIIAAAALILIVIFAGIGKIEH